MVGSFDFKAVETEVRELWETQQTYAKAKAMGSVPGAKSFYFLDGPPYTSGNVHLGTTWNKVLKDMVLRYKRMRGFNVWDRAGYDMHGLPTEHATEQELGIHGREQIQAYGVERFIGACRALCIRNMLKMNDDFKALGVWMDFDGAYQSISRDFMEGEWWLIKTAHEKGRLYEGERTMTWDAVNATALAKHELTYENVTEPAIYVRFPIIDAKTGEPSKDTYLLIWTTTPWTIPFNLAVMANPGIDYCKVSVVFDGTPQRWILAKDLLDPFIKGDLKIDYAIEEEFKGATLEGLAYLHPFAKHNAVYGELKAKHPKVHTVILSGEYVDTSAGTGLVHCAPGCGPEDYEVGHRNGIPPFNTIDEQGFCRDIVPFIGLEAKKEDEEFIRLIDREDALVHTHKYTHEYPFGERSKAPVIFRTTKQWFLKVEDIKDDLIAENDRIAWVPQAAYNAFSSWLANLRDNSISKQRFWGTPLPVWRNTDDPSDYVVVGGAKELAQLAGLEREPEDLHIPTVDKITFQRKGKDGKTHLFKRVPDVLDVWVDAGTTSWNCLGFPQRKDRFERLYPADFILEGKDQIRGWFNLLHVASMVALGKPAFKACYMHGFINDAQGRKMSKSLKNYILPEEVTSKYGVDATRYYMIGAANPGFDMNYNFDDLEAKYRNLLVFWNMHKYLIELSQQGGIMPLPIDELEAKGLVETEERYVLSRLNAAVRRMTRAFEEYRLNETPLSVEEFLLDLSRTYIQFVRDKAAAGTDDERLAVVSTLFHAVQESLIMLAPIAPYFAEAVYQDLREAFPPACKEESIHLRGWPVTDETRIDERLERDFVVAKDLITAILAARDKAQLGVRWPVQEVRVDCTAQQRPALERMRELILTQTNAKGIGFEPIDIQYRFEPNTKAIGKDFGRDTQAVMALVGKHHAALTAMLREHKETIVVDGKTLKAEHLNITRVVPDKYRQGEGNALRAYLDVTRTPDLEREGFAREIIRRIQQLRKTAGLVKADSIAVEVVATDDTLHDAVEEHYDSIADRVGAARLALVQTLSQDLATVSTESIKGKEFLVGFSVIE